MKIEITNLVAKYTLINLDTTVVALNGGTICANCWNFADLKTNTT